MHRFRAAIALLLHVILLQATVLGSWMPCAPSSAAAESATGAGDAAVHHAAAGHRASPAAPAGAVDEPPGDSRSPHHGAPSKCVTAPGCAVAVVAAPDVERDHARIVRSVAAALRVALPPSTRAAPEPPPPRA